MNGSDLTLDWSMKVWGQAAPTPWVYRLTRAEQLEGWWAWVAMVLLILGLLAWIGWLYRRDTSELPLPLRMALTALRFGAVIGLVVFYLGLERRTQQPITRPSEVAILLDVSQSMALPASNQTSVPRSTALVELLQRTPLVDRLAESHRVSVYTFGSTAAEQPIAVFGKPAAKTDSSASRAGQGLMSGVDRFGAISGLTLLVLAVVALLAALVFSFPSPLQSGWWVLVAVGLAMVGAPWMASSWCRAPGIPLASILRGDNASRADDGPSSSVEPSDEGVPKIDWANAIAASGVQTRLGDALRQVLQQHDPSTLAGVILATDGQSNTGASPESVVPIATRNETPLYVIGMGDVRPPAGAAIVDVDAPKRVYPGDQFEVQVLLQANGLSGRQVQVELLEGDASVATVRDSTGTTLVDTKEVNLPADDQLGAVRFQLTPKNPGKQTYSVRLVAPQEDRVAEDNVRVTQVEVVARRTKVLLLAGGPSRDYQFVRGQFYRDPSFESDVIVQSAVDGVSQEANQVLRDLPSTPQELFVYDVIVAFDPDWQRFQPEQLQLLDRWVAEQAGGLILVAGPVHMSEWTRVRGSESVDRIRPLFPVELSNRAGLSLDPGRFDGQSAWPLKLTADANRAPFLSLADDPINPLAAWGELSGVYGYYGSRALKPGAQAYAFFSDPSTAVDSNLPVYLASQFYGAGRTFFQASGETWRMRSVNDLYFESYWTKLVRWVGEGRLQRDSARGVLLIDKPRASAGDVVLVRAILTDEQFQPLQAAEVPCTVFQPDGRQQTLVLRRASGEPRPGTFVGQLLVRRPGDYLLELPIGGLASQEVLRQSVQVRLPAVELERSGRNDALLGQMASATMGRYYNGSEDVATTAASMLQTIEPRPLSMTLPGSVDRPFQERLAFSLMWLIAGMLLSEWLIRRLHRLA
jgi:hypothetical protein